MEDKQYCQATARGAIVKIIDIDHFKPGEYCVARYQDAEEVNLELLLLGKQTQDDRYVVVRVKDDYRYQEDTMKKLLLEKLDGNTYRIITRRFHHYPFENPGVYNASQGWKSALDILKQNGTIRIVDDQNGYYYGYAYDAIISNGHDITYDYVSRFYYPTKGNVGLIYLNESHRIAIVKKVADDLYQSVEYLDNDFDYSEAQTEFKNLVLNDEEGYIEFDLYLTYAYPGSRFAAHKKHYFKVPK